MKKLKLSIVILASICCSFCSKKQRNLESNNQISINEQCLSGFVLFEYIGEVNKPVKSLVLKTNSKDTSYYDFSQHKQSIHDKNSRLYLVKEYIISDTDYHAIKEYIVKRIKIKSSLNDKLQNTASSVVLIDNCDTIFFVVDYKSYGFYSEIMKILPDHSELNKSFNFYRKLQVNKTIP